jgi:hypothetical protein
MSKTIKAALLAAVFATGAGAAQATTITFDEFTPDSSHFLGAGATFATAGYDFKVNDGAVYFLNMPSNSGYATNGTTSLDLGGTVGITSAANKPFSVTAIDLATVYAPATSTVKFTGTDANGAQVTQSVTIDGAASANPTELKTTALVGFDNLTSFQMEIVYDADGSAFFSLVDNIMIDDAAASVPEPATFATLGLGLAMLAGVLRRKPR